MRIAHSTMIAITALATTALVVPQASLADPPAHAPAHGWRKKNDPNYVGYTGKKWQKDYGVLEGRCNSDEVGAVLGGIVGGTIGSQVGTGDSRAIAIVVGSVLGAAIGAKIGRDIDDSDRGCFGHALELVPNGKTVSWSNSKSGASYVLTPLGEAGSGCRRFKMQVKSSGRSETVTRTACRDGGGVWRVA